MRLVVVCLTLLQASAEPWVFPSTETVFDALFKCHLEATSVKEVDCVLQGPYEEPPYLPVRAPGSSMRFFTVATTGELNIDLNLLGDEADAWAKLAAEPETRLHLYGKREAKPGRKMGHINRLSGL